MFYKFALDLMMIQNDIVLPKKPEKELIFYEIVIKNGSNPIMRIPFKGGGTKNLKHKIELYDNDTEINKDRVSLSMSPHIARFDNSKRISFHACKVTKDVDNTEGPLINRIGYATHIEEGTSTSQDKAFFVLEKAHGSNKVVPEYFKDFTIITTCNKLKKVDEVALHESSYGSQYWLTQRRFYSTSHVTLSNSVHRENIQLLRDNFFKKYKKYKFSDLLNMLTTISVSVTKGRIKYKSDTMFGQNGVGADAGNVAIETSSVGDCEDFGHFYMRIFRLVVGTYKFFLKDVTSDIYQKCKQLEENYCCFNFICQVELERGLEFHSTMMIIPNNIRYPVISFEVTNPSKSYTLPDKEFHNWHTEHYFLVDNFFIARMNKVSIDKVVLSDLKFTNY